MPQRWLSNLKKSRPLLAEFLERKCAQTTSDLTEQESSYVLQVAYDKGVDEEVYEFFWACIRYHKEQFEGKEQSSIDQDN